LKHSKELFFLLFTRAAAAAPGSQYKENTEKDEAVSHEKPVVEIPHRKEFIAGQKADDAAKHQQAAEYSGGPAEPVDAF
jgi:hypothetical protein